MATEVPKFSGQLSHHNDGLLQITPHHLQPQNPSINPTGGQQRPTSKNERAMDKFREVVMKIAKISDPSTTPAAAAAQKNLIEQRLSDFFSDFHTPNHPPYAAMIHKAIQELNEKGGSSEESISNYIKKEYNDLPWAHCTLLKHHLSKLCDYGEIFVTRKRFYLIAGAKPCSDSCARPKREHLKRKRGSQLGRGRSRCRKKEETEEDDQQNGKQHREVIEGQEPFQEEKDEMIQKQNEPNKEKVILVEEQNLGRELPNEVIEERSVRHKQQNDVILDLVWQENAVMEDEARELVNGLIEGQSQQQIQESGAQQSQPHPEGPEELGGQLKLPESKSTVMTALTVPMNFYLLEKDQDKELPNLERPPRFELTAVTELYPTAPLETFLDLLPSPIQQQQPEPSNPEMAKELEQVTVEQSSGKDKLQRRCWSQSLHEPKSAATTTGELLPSLHSQDQRQLQTELPNPERTEVLKQTQLDNEVIEHEAHELENSLIQGQSQQKKEGSRFGAEQSQPHPEGPAKLGGKHNPPGFESTLKTALTYPVHLELHEKKQDEELPDKEMVLVAKSEAVESLNRQKQQANRDKFQPEGIEKQDVTINSEQIEREQLVELPNSERSVVLKITTVESLSHECQQTEICEGYKVDDSEHRTNIEPLSFEQRYQTETCGGHEADGSEPGTVVSSIDLPMDPKQIDEEQQPDISFPERPTELKLVRVERSCKTDRQQRQLRRWSQSLPKVKPAATSIPSHSQDQHPLQAEQPNPERPQELKQTPMENEVIEDEAHKLETSLIEGKSQQQKQESGISAEQSQPHPEGAAEFGGQLKPPKSNLTLETALTVPVNLDLLKKEQDKELANPVMPSEVEPTAATELSPTLHQIREDQRSKRQLRSQGRSHSVHKSAPFVELRRPELSSPEKSMELKLATINLLSHEQLQQADISGRHEVDGAEPGTIMISSELPMDSKLLDDEKQCDISFPNRPIELNPATVEQSSHTDRGQRQLRRWTRSPQPKQAVTYTGELLSSSHSRDEHPIQTELPSPERSQELKENPGEQSTQITVQRAKLRSWQKQNTPQPNVVAYSLDSAPPLERIELQPKPDLPLPDRSAELEPLEELSDHQKATQKKSLQGRLRPRPPKSETKPSDHQHQHEQQQQPVHLGQEQPPEPKPDTSVGESTRTDDQTKCVQQQTARRGRGRPSESKPDTPVGELTRTDHQNPCVQEQTARRGRGRGRPLETKPDTPLGESTRTDNQNTCVQEQPAHRGRGRPSESKPDTPVGESTRTDHQNPCVLEQPARRVRDQPLEPKPDTPLGESTRTDNQNPCVLEQPACRGRGRLPEPKTDTPVGESTKTDHHNPCVQEQSARRGRGRPPKPKPDSPVGESMRTNHQNPCVREEPACDTPVGESTRTDDQVQEQPARRGRGRPPKRGRGKP